MHLFALFVSNKNNLYIAQDTLVFPSDSHCVMKPSEDRSAPSEPLRVCSHSAIATVLSVKRSLCIVHRLRRFLWSCPDENFYFDVKCERAFGVCP